MSSEQKGFIAEVRSKTGVNVNRCYQCGKCSAGCALNENMDYPPSVVMRLLQTNSAESYNKILHSQTIWLCVSCQNCLTRCPMQIDIPQLMDYLRVQALEKKTVSKKSKKIVAFHRAFLDSVRYTGRLYEIGLVADYKVRTFDLLQDLNVAPRMFLKGKLPLLPEIVKKRIKF
ncbi:MAG: 4Fe-4S dicluster domain-containing protein [Prevotellaceae bacterium]|jgi:heterodisulfide reductase subunit C|nr:4Fe-4S dicluster domain-containing protein [Prevotellaceae bacterium]